MSPYVETVSCGEFFLARILQKSSQGPTKVLFFLIKTSKWEKWWSWWLRMTNAFILCNLLWKVQKRLTVNREGSFNVCVQGWEDGVLGMKKGGQRMLVIPPQFAYGSKGFGSKVPPHSTLIFEVEVVRVSLQLYIILQYNTIQYKYLCCSDKKYIYMYSNDVAQMLCKPPSHTGLICHFIHKA